MKTKAFFISVVTAMIFNVNAYGQSENYTEPVVVAGQTSDEDILSTDTLQAQTGSSNQQPSTEGQVSESEKKAVQGVVVTGTIVAVSFITMRWFLKELNRSVNQGIENFFEGMN